jgi:hypothetical protein
MCWSISSAATYAENLNLNRPHIWLPWCQEVFAVFFGLLQVDAYTK